MEYRRVLGGKFEVNALGEVYRIRDGKRELATQTRTGRNKRYAVVTYRENNKQKHVYVHRLIAEAFIPNPEGRLEVNHIDGNPLNNRAENLEWATRQENAQHGYRTGLINPYRNGTPCQRCGEPTRAKDGICPACKMDLRQEAKREERLAKLRESLLTIDQDRLTPTEKHYVQLRMAGNSLQGIGKICGVSRQCVDEAIKNSYLKSGNFLMSGAAIHKQAQRILTQIERKHRQVRQAEAELSKLYMRLGVLSGAREEGKQGGKRAGQALAAAGDRLEGPRGSEGI